MRLLEPPETMEELKGTRFGMLLVIGELSRKAPLYPLRRKVIKFKCSCGKVDFMNLDAIFKEHARSCGCAPGVNASPSQHLPPERRRTYQKNLNRWRALKDKCLNPKSRSYASNGGRGVKLCDQWRKDSMSFINYLDEVLGECPKGSALCLVDYNGNYEPGNVQWSTMSGRAKVKRAGKEPFNYFKDFF